MKVTFYLGIVVLLIVSAIFMRGQYQRRLLRDGLDKVEKVKIIYYGGNYQSGSGNVTVLTSGKDKDLISELYKKIAGTKLSMYAIPDEEERQESDPLFEINFTYKNGESDKIESTETGKGIYRRLFGSGWVGGACEDLLGIIKSLVAQGAPERM